MKKLKIHTYAYLFSWEYEDFLKSQHNLNITAFDIKDEEIVRFILLSTFNYINILNIIVQHWDCKILIELTSIFECVQNELAKHNLKLLAKKEIL